MSSRYSEIAFTPAVSEAQEHRGSRRFYDRQRSQLGPSTAPDPLTGSEREFLSACDGFYLATVSESGWPYVQYRGGPPGFLVVLDEHTIGWADFRGNLQYITTGNVTGDDRVALIVMDYAAKERLKIFGHANIVDAESDPELARRLSRPGYNAVVERAVLVDVEGYDWNCPQHITQKFTVAEIEERVAPLRRQLAACLDAAVPPASPTAG